MCFTRCKKGCRTGLRSWCDGRVSETGSLEQCYLKRLARRLNVGRNDSKNRIATRLGRWEIDNTG